jgi:probable rRNA maturation factor
MNTDAFGQQEALLPTISFHDEDAGFLPDNFTELKRWIQQVIKREGCTLQQLAYIFCSDAYLHRINIDYLQHDTYTDIITFPYEDPPLIHSDIFISVERVRDNAQQYNLPFQQELHRVAIHGVLHLCGYPDKTPEEAQKMRQKEDEALHLLSQL